MAACHSAKATETIGIRGISVYIIFFCKLANWLSSREMKRFPPRGSAYASPLPLPKRLEWQKLVLLFSERLALPPTLTRNPKRRNVNRLTPLSGRKLSTVFEGTEKTSEIKQTGSAGGGATTR